MGRDGNDIGKQSADRGRDLVGRWDHRSRNDIDFLVELGRLWSREDHDDHRALGESRLFLAYRWSASSAIPYLAHERKSMAKTNVAV